MEKKPRDYVCTCDGRDMYGRRKHTEGCKRRNEARKASKHPGQKRLEDKRVKSSGNSD